MAKRLLTGLLMLLITTPAWAQFVCTGTDCDKINRQYGNYFSSFQQRYLPLLGKDLLVSQAIAGVGGVPHHVSLNRWTVGAYGTAGMTGKSTVVVQNSVNGEIKRLPEAGFAVEPNYYAGVNAGWLLNTSLNMWEYVMCTYCRDEVDYASFVPLLNRIDLYVYGIGSTNTSGQQYNNTTTHRSFNSRGYEMSIAAIREQRLLWDILKFSGLSLQAGRYISHEDLQYYFSDSIKLANTDFSLFEWSGKNRFNYKADTETSFIQFRTGIKLLDFLGVYGGAGGSYSRANASISFSRNALVATPISSTMYNVNLNTQARDNLKMGYYTAGVNLGPITIQGTRSIGKNALTAKYAYAATLGLTFNY